MSPTTSELVGLLMNYELSLRLHNNSRCHQNRKGANLRATQMNISAETVSGTTIRTTKAVRQFLVELPLQPVWSKWLKHSHCSMVRRIAHSYGWLAQATSKCGQ